MHSAAELIGSVQQLVPHSQPFAELLSQSKWPGSHVPTAQPVGVHAGVAFGAVHALPQPPQLAPSLCGFEQAPLQHCVSPPVHATPQPLQLSGSVRVLVQLPPQHAAPGVSPQSLSLLQPMLTPPSGGGARVRSKQTTDPADTSASVHATPSGCVPAASAKLVSTSAWWPAATSSVMASPAAYVRDISGAPASAAMVPSLSQRAVAP